jgi:dolichol-phosphate mannosyltransferase
MVTILIVGGIIMTMLGTIGEYIWRIYDEVRDRPLYIVRERHGNPPPAEGGGVDAALETREAHA